MKRQGHWEIKDQAAEKSFDVKEHSDLQLITGKGGGCSAGSRTARKTRVTPYTS